MPLQLEWGGASRRRRCPSQASAGVDETARRALLRLRRPVDYGRHVVLTEAPQPERRAPLQRVPAPRAEQATLPRREASEPVLPSLRGERPALPLDATLARAVRGRTLARATLKLPTASPDLTAVRTAVKAYNKHNSSAPARRLSLLRTLDQAIYAWYAQLGAPQISGPKAKQMAALVIQSEDEFANVVASHGHKIVPVDMTGMTLQEQQDVEDLWESIRTNSGRICVQGSKDYVRRTRASLAKILNTPTGRKLLNYLDQPGMPNSNDMSERVVIADVFPGGLDTNGLDLNQKSYAKGFALGGAAAGVEEQLTKRAAAPVKKKRKNYKAVKKPRLRDAAVPTGVEEAIWAGKRGIKIGTDYFEFGTGATGAFVHTIRPEDLDQDIPNRAGNVAFTPEFITLAHELGHTMHHLAGATTGAIAVPDAYYPGGSQNWTNPEELFTILGIDNPIRAEAGLQVRASHATLPSARSALKQQRRDELLGRAQTLFGKVLTKPAKQAQMQTEVQAYMMSVGAAVAGNRPLIIDDRVYNKLKAAVVKLEKRYP